MFRGARPASRWLLVVVLSLVYTLLNSIKPLQVDDTAHYYYAVQIAKHPLDPYGFQVFWYESPDVANHVLTPLFADYWWALAIRLFGENEWLWKMWLWPFSFLFVGALSVLLHRFARGLEGELLVLTVLSPLFLPSLNFMLDVPALALSLCALILFMRACDRDSISIASAAGVVAACSMQTKYTGFLTPVVMSLYGCLFSKFRLGIVPGIVAALLFAVVECLIAYRYGESHFIYHLHYGGSLLGRLLLGPPLLSILGTLTPGVLLLGMLAMRLPRWILWLTACVLLSGYLLVAFIPASYSTYRAWFVIGGRFTMGDVIFGGFGVATCAIAMLVLGRLCRTSRMIGRRMLHWKRYRVEMFLTLWLALEVAGYFALSPFPAARRVMGLVTAATLCVGRLASLTCRSRTQKPYVRIVVAGSVILGLLFYGIDLRDAFAQKLAAEAAADFIKAEGIQQIWFVGHWGFQYYAEKAGMRPVAPMQTELTEGEWLVIPDERVEQQGIVIDPNATELEGEVQIGDHLPWHTVRGFYGGHAPLEHQEGPRLTVRIYRVTTTFTPAWKPPPPRKWGLAHHVGN